MTLFEVDEVMRVIRGRMSENANIIFGTSYDDALENEEGERSSLSISIIVSGIKTDVIAPEIDPEEARKFREEQQRLRDMPRNSESDSVSKSAEAQELEHHQRLPDENNPQQVPVFAEPAGKSRKEEGVVRQSLKSTILGRFFAF